MNVGETIGPVALKTAKGASVDLHAYLDRTRIISSPRYYG